MWREQCFSSESTEIEFTTLFSGLVTTKSSDHKRTNIFGSLRECEMVWPITWEGLRVDATILGAQAAASQRIAGEANFQPPTKSTRRKRQQIRAQPKDKNAS